MVFNDAKLIRTPVRLAVQLALAGVVGSGVSAGAWAQGAPPQAAGAAQSGQAAPPVEGGELQEVIVTAQIRAQSEQTIPISMSVVSGNQLNALQQINMVDMQTTTPNFTVNTTGSGGEVNIRGVGLNGNLPGNTPGVAILRDGLLDEESVGGSIYGNFYDIDNVSVLKGPQGTYIGSAAIGGAVEINSRSPTFGPAVSGYVEGQLGNYSDNKVDGAVNMPVSDTFAVRLAFNYETRGSFYHDLGGLANGNTTEPNIGSNAQPGSDPGHVDNHNVRLGLLWKPSDSFQALFKTELDTTQTGGNGYNINPATFTNPVTGVVSHAPYYTYATGQPFLIDQSIPYQSQYSSLQINRLELRYTLPDQIVLRSLSGYQATRSLSYNGGGTSFYTGESFGAVSPDPYMSQEFDVISPTTWRVNFIAGASAFYRNSAIDNSAATASPPFSAALPELVYNPAGPWGTIARTEGLFANVNWQMTDTLQLQVGGRENWDDTGNYGFFYIRLPSPPEPQTIVSVDINNGTVTDSVPTGKVGLNWTPLPGQLFYAFIARGYKAAGLGIASGNVAQPEHDTDIELGWKGGALNGHLQTDVGGFYMKYQDMQEATFDSADPQYGNSALVNLAGGSTIYGLEASTQGTIDHIVLNASLGYTHSALGKITAVDGGELPSNYGALPQCANGAVFPACFNYLPYEVTLTGEPNAMSPELSADAMLGYNVQLGNNVLTPELMWRYVAKQYTSVFQQNNYYEMPAYGLLDAQITYVAGSWEMEGYVRNITNRLYEVGNTGSDVYYGAPREFGVRVKKSF